MSKNFEGYYPPIESRPFPLEISRGEFSEDFTLTAENCQIIKYWDTPEKARVIKRLVSEDYPIVSKSNFIETTYLPLAEQLMSHEFYLEYGWNPDLVVTTESPKSIAVPFVYTGEHRSETYPISPQQCNIIQYHDYPMLDHILVSYFAPKLTPEMLPSSEMEKRTGRLFRPDLVETFQSQGFYEQNNWRPDLYVYNRVPEEVFTEFEYKARINMENGLKGIRRFGEQMIISSRYPS